MGNAGAKRCRIGDFLRCSDPPPKVRGRRNTTCRVCGYAVAPQARTTVRLECCDQKLHADCFAASAELAVSQLIGVQKCCSKLKHLLEKDRKTKIQCPAPSKPVTASSQPNLGSTPKRRGSKDSFSQDAQGGPVPVICPYCKEPVAISNTRHYLYECRAISGIYDPGGGVDYSRLTPLARRTAGMTRLQRKSGNLISSGT